MPKETIRSRYEYREDEPNELVTEVRWSRDADYVQLATVVLNRSDGTFVTREVDGGWFADLDRHGINNLIRHLRRARDQAFGRDE